MRKTAFVLLALLALALVAIPTHGMAQAPQPGPMPQPAPLPPKPTPAPAPAPPPAPCPCDNCKEVTLEAPETLAVWVGRQAALVVKCGKAVTIIPPDADDDVTIVPSFTANTFIVTAYLEGSYTVTVAAASAGEVKYAKVKIVAKTKPAKPDVKPVPKPDDKPGPVPTPPPAPAPIDPLAKELQNAYTLDSTADKADQIQALAALYKSAADKVADASTGGALLADLKAVAAAMKIPDAALPLVRSRIGVELKKVLVVGTLTAAQKDATKALFLQLAAGLAACK